MPEFTILDLLGKVVKHLPKSPKCDRIYLDEHNQASVFKYGSWHHLKTNPKFTFLDVTKQKVYEISPQGRSELPDDTILFHCQSRKLLKYDSQKKEWRPICSFPKQSGDNLCCLSKCSPEEIQQLDQTPSKGEIPVILKDCRKCKKCTLTIQDLCEICQEDLCDIPPCTPEQLELLDEDPTLGRIPVLIGEGENCEQCTLTIQQLCELCVVVEAEFPSHGLLIADCGGTNYGIKYDRDGTFDKIASPSDTQFLQNMGFVWVDPTPAILNDFAAAPNGQGTNPNFGNEPGLFVTVPIGCTLVPGSAWVFDGSLQMCGDMDKYQMADTTTDLPRIWYYKACMEPFFLSINPLNGSIAGGDILMLTGNNFQIHSMNVGTQVLIDGVPVLAANVSVTAHDELMVTMPPHVGGFAIVQVHNMFGTSGKHSFIYA